MTWYDFFVFIHILLFVAWLGGDIGVFVLGQNFRKRSWSIEQRLGFLKVLGVVDLFPRVAWALMAPVALTMVRLGGWSDLSPWVIVAAWFGAVFWLYLIAAIHRGGDQSRTSVLRGIEFMLKAVMGAGFLCLGVVWIFDPASQPGWLTAKALAFSLVFAAAIMIDVAFKPLTGALAEFISTNGGEEHEGAVLEIMNATRRWVIVLYVLLLVMAFFGTMKPAIF